MIMSFFGEDFLLRFEDGGERDLKRCVVLCGMFVWYLEACWSR